MKETGASVFIFNQANGPLLRDFVKALTEASAKCTVLMGCDGSQGGEFPAGVVIRSAHRLNRSIIATRLYSWVAYSLAAAGLLLRCGAEARVVLFTNPPILPWFGWLCSLVRGYRYSVVVYDIYPDVAVGMGLMGEGHVLVRLWRRLNRLAYERACAVITLGEVMAGALAAHFDPARTAARRILISRTWVDTSLIRPLRKADNPFAVLHGQMGRHLTVLHSGNMGATHEMETILGAARLLEGRCEMQFLFIGDGTGYEALERAARDLSNVKVLPWQAEEWVPYIWAAAEIAFVTLRPGVERCSFPSKTAYALAAGCAVVGLTRTPSDLADIIGRSGCGVVVSPGDTEGLARCLTALADDAELLGRYRAQARAAAEEFFDAAGNIGAMMAGVFGEMGGEEAG